jgi:hypothetical protein
MKKVLFLIILFALSSSSFARKKDSVEHGAKGQRDQYAKQLAAAIEHDGWQPEVWATRPGCGQWCANHGNHDGLRVHFGAGLTVAEVDRFMGQEIRPRIQELKNLGFVEVDLLGLEASHTYPTGTARFPIK